MKTGTVKFFNNQKGFGFIQPDGGGPDVFVHATALERAGIGSLTEGQKVSFDKTTGPKGDQASNIRPARPAGRSPPRTIRKGLRDGKKPGKPGFLFVRCAIARRYTPAHRLRDELRQRDEVA